MKVLCLCLSQAWQRPTLPRLKTQYHWRWGDLRPSSRWDRVWTPRQSHQAGEEQREPKHKLKDRFVFLVPSSMSMDINNESNQAVRTISTGKLRTLLPFHTRPINEVVFLGSQGRNCFEVGFPLRCIQRLSRPHIATLLYRWRDNRSTGGAFIPVLSY